MTRPIRRTQAIAPFGPGAMVDFSGPVSLIHAGLDAWPFDERNQDHREFRIDDETRLARRLKVEYFVQPPDFRRRDKFSGEQLNQELKLPFLRFPLWHSCPRCGLMHKGGYHDQGAPTCTGPIGTGKDAGQRHSQRTTFQVRFVAACRQGHIQDFPWVDWVFSGDPGDWEPNRQDRWLRMMTSASASLAGVTIQAEEHVSGGKPRVVKRRTLAGAFTTSIGPEGGVVNVTALSELGVNCTGINPVLAIGTDRRPPLRDCDEPLFSVLKSASNLYFPSVVNSIYIPDIDDTGLPQELLDLLDDRGIRDHLCEMAINSDDGLVSSRSAKRALNKFHPESRIDPEIVAKTANQHLLHRILIENQKTHALLDQFFKVSGDLTIEDVKDATESLDWDISPGLLLDPLRAYFKAEQSSVEETSDDSSDEETSYRRQEYSVFSRDLQTGYPKTDLDIRGADLAQYGPLVRNSFRRIGLLHKLRDTRAFDGFSRIYSSGLGREEKRALFMSEPKPWLPAIIVRGEGIFLQFSEEKLKDWLAQHGSRLDKRLSLMLENMEALAKRRNQEPRHLSPRFVLLHTFAHLLINQLVHDCGYGSASLRERIYSADGDHPMAGVLIYTAAGDSEGTMGGLVRMGQADRLDDVIIHALSKARWCSSDPICIESKGQGPDNCNLAACHSCGLLPETSCEEQNRLLDRGLVVGTVENPSLGFFSSSTS